MSNLGIGTIYYHYRIKKWHGKMNDGLSEF